MANWITRQQWQEFKKRFPQFEKSKLFKSDLGPQLEKWQKIEIELETMGTQFQTRLEAVRPVIRSIQATLKGYEAIVAQVAKDNPTLKSSIEHDFKTFFTDRAQIAEEWLDELLKELKGNIKLN